MLNSYIDNIDKYLHDFLPINQPLTEAINYSIIGSGKRFRAKLCYLVAMSFGAKDEVIHSSSCALEMIHSYSLIHDDLPAMDDDNWRHNKLTNHKKFNEATAILAGDALQSLAFTIIINDKNLTDNIKIDLLNTLSSASFLIANGQKLDIDADDKIDLIKLENIHMQKTAPLIISSIEMGAIIAKVDIKNMELLLNFGKKIGLAYQIQDDVLDVLGSNNIGKSSNSDLKNNKTTYIDLLGEKQATIKYNNLYNKALEILTQLTVNTDKLVSLILTIKNRKF